jgi:hypothetical protein
MLIDYLVDSYLELTGQLDPVQPVVTLQSSRTAANAGSYRNSEMQARRHRRQRRLDRSAQPGTSGWAVRAW